MENTVDQGFLNFLVVELFTNFRKIAKPSIIYNPNMNNIKVGCPYNSMIELSFRTPKFFGESSMKHILEIDTVDHVPRDVQNK